MNVMRTGLAALLVGLSVVGGCASEAQEKAILARARALRASPEYVMGNGDSVTIRLLGDDGWDVTATIRPDGKIAIPGMGDIEVEGKTPEGLRGELEERITTEQQLRKRAKIHVAVNTFTSKTVTILGEVARPGRYPYTGQMRVVDLLGSAIATLPSASPNRSMLFREVDGQIKVYQVRLKDFFQNADFATNFYVRPGDVVYVPRNGFARVARGVTIVTAPISAVFNAVGLGARTTTVFTGGAVN